MMVFWISTEILILRGIVFCGFSYAYIDKMEIYQTTTKDLLIHIRRKILNFRKYFPGLKPEFTGIGFLGQSPMFPAVSVVPVQWAITQRFSNGQYNVSRQVEIQFYADDTTNEKAQRKIKDYIDRFVGVLMNDRGLFFEDVDQRSIAFNFDYQPIRYENIKGQVRGYKVRMGAVPLTVFSRDYRPAQNPKFGHIVKESDNGIFERVFRRVLNNRSGKLRGVKEFSKNNLMPHAGGLTISAQMEGASVDQQSTSADLFDFSIPFTVWTKLLPDNRSLLKNVEVAEIIKDILDEDETFRGALWNSEVSSMEFGVEQSQRASFYTTRVNFLGRKHKSTLAGNK